MIMHLDLAEEHKMESTEARDMVSYVALTNEGQKEAVPSGGKEELKYEKGQKG